MHLKIFRKMDIFILILFILVTVASFLLLRNPKSNEARLVVKAPEKEFVYSLEIDRVIKIAGVMGVSKIVIKDGRAYFEDSPCKNKTCIHMGAVCESNDWAACLPNDIFIRVE